MKTGSASLTLTLSLAALSLVGCSSSGGDEADSTGGAVTASPAGAAPIRLTQANCRLVRPDADAAGSSSSFFEVASGPQRPLACLPTGELEGKTAFLTSASTEYSVRPAEPLIGEERVLAIVDARPHHERRQTLLGGGAGSFLVREEPSVVSFEATAVVSQDEPGLVELGSLRFRAVSSDLQPVQATVRAYGAGNPVTVSWVPGTKDLVGEPLAPMTCAATVVLKVEPGGILPNDDGTESKAHPRIVAFHCK